MTLLNELIAYYKLDETSGTTVNDIKGTYNGVNDGAALGTTGKIKTCYDFERGDEDNIILNTALPNTVRAVSVWAKKESLITTMCVISFNNDIAPAGIKTLNLEMTDTDGRINYEGGVLDTGSLLGNARWNHIVYQLTSTGHEIWVNGSLAASDADTTWISDVVGYTHTSIGSQEAGGTNNFEMDGLLDEIGIWTRCLTDDEIKALYNSGDGLAYPLEVPLTGTTGTAAIATRYPVTVGTTAKTTKQTGQNLGLVAQQSKVLNRKKIGIR